MCLAAPGKIIAIEDNIATVDYGSEQREGMIVEGEYSIGDFVIIQGKIVLDKIPEDEVRDWLSFFDTQHDT